MGTDNQVARKRSGRGKRQIGRHRKDGVSNDFTQQQLPWQQIRNSYPPLQVISADEVESIHQASLTILEEIGMDFLLPDARELLKRAGADVKPDSERVRFDRQLVEQSIIQAPASFTVYARNPEHNLLIGDNVINYSPVASAPNCSDLARGRRPGSQQDYRDFYGWHKV